MSKKYLLIFACLLLLISCQHTHKRNWVKSHIKTSLNKYKVVDSQYYKSPLLKEYSLFLSALDTAKMESVTAAAEKYTSLFKGRDTHICDSAFFIFDEFYGLLANKFNDLPFKDTTMKYDSLLYMGGNNLSKPTGRVGLFGQKLKDNGLMIDMTEGDYYIGQDLDFVAKWFYRDVSSANRTYLAQLNKENKQGFQEDAGLTIDNQTLVDRTIWWEKFAAAHPNSILTDRAKSSWRFYLGTLMTGMDNTPVKDVNGIDDYYKSAYTYLQNKYPNSQTNKYIKPYFKLLLQKDNNEADKLIETYRKAGIIQ